MPRYLSFISPVWLGLAVCAADYQGVLALDKNRLWLPGKYTDAMPGLVEAAKEAENSERCIRVVDGQMNVRKSTEKEYYFVITCMDDKHVTYKLSYLHPVGEGGVRLLSMRDRRKIERKASQERKKNKNDKTNGSVDVQTAKSACADAVAAETGSIEGALTLKREAQLVQENHSDFLFHVPFTLDGASGARVRFRADCQINSNLDSDVKIVLAPKGAKTLCRDTLKKKTLSMQRIHIEDKPLEFKSLENGGYHYVMAFSSKGFGGNQVNYVADCSVEADGSNTVEVQLNKAGALEICKEALLDEAVLLKSIKILEDKLELTTQSESEFRYDIPFDALAMGGGSGRFKAICYVDFEGEGEVTFSIEHSTAVDLCIKKLMRESRTMIGVNVKGRTEIVLEQNQDGYTGAIPFNARNPGGKELHYKAFCEIDNIGVASVKISPG